MLRLDQQIEQTHFTEGMSTEDMSSGELTVIDEWFGEDDDIYWRTNWESTLDKEFRTKKPYTYAMQ